VPAPTARAEAAFALPLYIEPAQVIVTVGFAFEACAVAWSWPLL
jgi:hypothetical protein